jgi:hypothetical protein
MPVFDHLEPRAADDRRMVRPRRGSDQYPGVRIGGLDQPEAQSQRAAAAGRLEPGDATVASMLAEQDRAQQLGETNVAAAAEIGLGLLAFPQLPLGFLDRAKDRRVAIAVAEDADPDVDLVGRDRLWRARSARAANRS